MSTEHAHPGVRDRIQGLELVDHHVHSILEDRPTSSQIQALLTESDTQPGTGVFDSQIGFALRRHCAPLLGLPPHAGVEEYLAARAGHTPGQLAALLLTAARVSNWLVDTGFNPDPLMSLDDLAALRAGAIAEIVRLESLLESIARASSAERLARDFVEALEARLDSAVGFKSVIAYRHGFDIDPTRPAPAEIRQAAGRWLRALDRGAPLRVSDPVLLRMTIWAAADTGLPLQLHAGFGDPDVDLHRCDPLLLTPLIRAVRGRTRLVLLHCYPFHRQAGYLAHAYDHVYFDVGLATNYLGAASTSLIAESMELAPFNRILYSSDAYGLPELHYLGSVLWRRAMTSVINNWVRQDEWSVHDAVRIARMIGHDNAAALYGLDT